MIHLEKKSASHLISAYNRMMSDMRNAFEQAEPNDISLQKALDLARQQATHLGDVTAEEAHEIGEYIKRDINDAAEFMMETSSEFYDWLMLDIEVIEHRVMELFLSVADHTRIELERFKQTATASALVPVYQSGEITGPGTLVCEHCGQNKAFIQSDEISDCDKCGHNRFIRHHQSGEK